MARSSVVVATHAAVRPKRGANTVIVDGLDVLVRDLTRAAETAKPRAERVVVDWAEKAAQGMRERVTIDDGGLLDSITSDPSATALAGAVYADAGPDPNENNDAYTARWVEYGTAAHTIAAKGRGKRARRAKVLASSTEVFGRTGQHPGARKKPFLGPATDAILPGFTKAVGDLGKLE